MSDITFVQGVKIDQRKLRAYLKQIDIENDIEQFLITEGPDKGKWRSPVNGALFDTKYQLWGQLGAYLRTPKPKDPREPTRAGYVRALRRGLEPTEAQKEAHRKYARDHRRKKRAKLTGLPESQSEEAPTEQVKIPALSWD